MISTLPKKSPLLFAVILVGWSIPTTARAQTCTVTQQPAVSLFGPPAANQCGDTGVLCASTVRIAIDPTTDTPVVLWHSDDERVRFRRFSGSDWDPVEEIPTGGIVVPEGDVGPVRAVSHAVDAAGTMHVIIADANGVYHLRNEGTWSAPESVASLSLTTFTNLGTFVGFDSQNRMHVTYWYEQGTGRVFYAQKANGIWGAWEDVGGGDARHIDVAVGSDGSVHVTWTHRNPEDPSFPGLRNWQAFYQTRDPQGTWHPVEQVSQEDPVDPNIGPIAIHPSVAVDVQGAPHVIYPVDPPEALGDDDGHASYSCRGVGGWSSPDVLFQNARHSAVLDLVIDAADVKYAFGLNLRRRMAVDPQTGVWQTSEWDSRGGRRFYMEGATTAAGAWLAYTAGRVWGPVEVLQFTRGGSCAPLPDAGADGAAADGAAADVVEADQGSVDAPVVDSGVAEVAAPGAVPDDSSGGCGCRASALTGHGSLAVIPIVIARLTR